MNTKALEFLWSRVEQRNRDTQGGTVWNDGEETSISHASIAAVACDGEISIWKIDYKKGEVTLSCELCPKSFKLRFDQIVTPP